MAVPERDLFTDPVRTGIADRAVQVLAGGQVDGLDGEELEFYRRRVRAIAARDPDTLYVWAYHTVDNELLIEWARRRRSYHYLGLHWALSRSYANDPTHPHAAVVLQILLLAGCAAWACGAWYLSKPMRRDADDMELAWSCGRLYPAFRTKAFEQERVG